MKRSVALDDRVGLRADLASASMIREIQSAISSGSLKPGDRLPSEAQLKAKYGISVGSIRRGMELLVKEGILNRRRGSGTYIQAIPQPPPEPTHVMVDTVLLAVEVHHVPTHPFFGARDRALKHRLNTLGWKVNVFANGRQEAADSYTIWSKMDMPRLLQHLETDQRIAGIIVDRFTVEAVVAAVGNRLPCLCLTATELCPFADYRWAEECIKAVRLAVEAGARRLWLVGAEFSNTAMLQERLGYPPGFLDLRCTPIPQQPIQTSMAHDAYEAARGILKAEGPRVDAIVMASEYHAQGVLDALSSLRTDEVRPLRLVAMINKESRLNTAFPVTTLVADGAAAGIAQADLIHQHITLRDHAPEFVCLSTTVCAAKGWPRPA